VLLQCCHSVVAVFIQYCYSYVLFCHHAGGEVTAHCWCGSGDAREQVIVLLHCYNSVVEILLQCYYSVVTVLVMMLQPTASVVADKPENRYLCCHIVVGLLLQCFPSVLTVVLQC
jgi:hypothetical protein